MKANDRQERWGETSASRSRCGTARRVRPSAPSGARGSRSELTPRALRRPSAPRRDRLEVQLLGHPLMPERHCLLLVAVDVLSNIAGDTAPLGLFVVGCRTAPTPPRPEVWSAHAAPPRLPPRSAALDRQARQSPHRVHCPATQGGGRTLRQRGGRVQAPRGRAVLPNRRASGAKRRHQC